MSYDVRTITFGKFNAGFWGTDCTRLMLGSLPVISLEQFSDFTAETFVTAVPEMTTEETGLLRQKIARIRRNSLDKLAVRTLVNRYTGFESMEDLFADLEELPGGERQHEVTEAMAMIHSNSLGNLPELYKDNPFIYMGDFFSVGGLYVVEPTEFVQFSTTYLGGGAFGWQSDLGVPGCIAEAVVKIEGAINPSVSPT